MPKESKAVSLDCGTMFFQIAEQNKSGDTVIKTTRNAFVEIKETEDIEDELRRNKWQYVKDGNRYYVIGEDSMRVANMFPGAELRRPLQDGVMNKQEDKKMLVLNELIKSSIGVSPTTTSLVCTCVSSESADESVDSKFHKARLMGMIKNLGWNVKVIEEGFAVILAERPVMVEDGKEIPYSGIGMSFGAGRVNCVAAWRGRQIDGLGMSVARSGDWIDQKVAEATGSPVNQVTRIKERQLDFDNIDYDNDVIFALDTYYGDMIRYVFEKFSIRFKKIKPEFESPVPIILAGGTSTPKGFCSKVQDVVGDLELPFVIKEVKISSSPHDAVVTGCLTQALISQKKIQKDRAEALDGLDK
jgi:hypothetical protein